MNNNDGSIKEEVSQEDPVAAEEPAQDLNKLKIVHFEPPIMALVQFQDENDVRTPLQLLALSQVTGEVYKIAINADALKATPEEEATLKEFLEEQVRRAMLAEKLRASGPPQDIKNMLSLKG